MQHENAEWKCSTRGPAQVHAHESVGELGVVVVVVCGATAGDLRGVSAGVGAQSRRADIPRTLFLDKSFFYGNI